MVAVRHNSPGQEIRLEEIGPGVYSPTRRNWRSNAGFSIAADNIGDFKGLGPEDDAARRKFNRHPPKP